MPSERVKTLTKRGLIEEISRKTVLPKKEIERFLYQFLSAVTGTLKDGGKVQLIPFGTFLVQERKQRQVRNPKTGLMVSVKARRVPSFRCGKMLRTGFH